MPVYAEARGRPPSRYYDDHRNDFVDGDLDRHDKMVVVRRPDDRIVRALSVDRVARPSRSRRSSRSRSRSSSKRRSRSRSRNRGCHHHHRHHSHVREISKKTITTYLVDSRLSRTRRVTTMETTRTTFMRVRVAHIRPETLDYFRYPWEWDRVSFQWEPTDPRRTNM